MFHVQLQYKPSEIRTEQYLPNVAPFEQTQASQNWA